MSQTIFLSMSGPWCHISRRNVRNCIWFVIPHLGISDHGMGAPGPILSAPDTDRKCSPACTITHTVLGQGFLYFFTILVSLSMFLVSVIHHSLLHKMILLHIPQYLPVNRNPENDAKIKVEKSWYKLYQFHASTWGNEYINAMKHFELVFWAYLEPRFLSQFILLIKWPIEGF